MTIELNGQPVHLDAGARVSDAVAETGATPDGRGVAVAVDGQVVPRSAWGEVSLVDGQRVEVVGAVQGG